MKIVHVITGLGKASGVTTFVENVVREQRALGHEVEVVTNANHKEKFRCSPSPFTLICDLIHIHGLWSPLLHRASRYAAKCHIPVVWSTHGMTAPWSLHHKWWKKCLPWYLYQRPDLRRAALIHCTTDLEESWNHALGFTNTFIAPLGTALPVDATSVRVPVNAGSCPRQNKTQSSTVQPSTSNLQPPPPPPRPRTLLYVGRIYPVKALDNLIRAFALAITQQSNTSTLPRGCNSPNCTSSPTAFWRLRIVGPDQAGHLAELKDLAHSLCLRDSVLKIEFAGPKYGTDLDAEYENCDALALVSHTENFGATVIDALAHAKPVITSTNTPWSIVQGQQTDNSAVQPPTFNHQPDACGWWVPNDPESLSKAILELMSLSDAEREGMGRRGRKLVEEKYTWPAVARAILFAEGELDFDREIEK